VGVWGDGITIGCGRPGVVLREMGMIVLGPAVDWLPLVSFVALGLSLCSLVWLTLLTTLSASTTSPAMIKGSLSTRSASSALEPDSEELASSMGERGPGPYFQGLQDPLELRRSRRGRTPPSLGRRA